MIYFDNAATTMLKPPEVAQAVADALTHFGGVGRGVHGASLSAGMAVFEARDAVAALLGASSASRVSFTSNVTESLNTALFGLLGPGDHAITTAASHNSVLRPLYALETQGMELSIAPICPDGSLDYDQVEALFRPNTRVLAVTHASNLTGDLYDIDRLAKMAHAHGALIVVDAAQTAGVVPLNAVDQQLDVLCFTGHKGLYGPQGTGGLVVAEGVEIAPLKVGGSGTHSYDREHPAFMPERLEAGTINGHGIAGLAAGVAFIQRTGVQAIRAHEDALAQRFEQGIANIPGMRVLGGKTALGRTGIVAVNLANVDSGQVADALSVDYGIATRAGAHCAPLMHKALGTEHQGAVRFSFGWFNTEAEVDQAVQALRQIAADLG